jgi:DNA-binding MarR family transcriptional regulator
MATFDFETSFGRILGMAHTAMVRHLGKLLKEKGLPVTPEQLRVLTHLWNQDGIPQSNLAACSDRNKANVTRIVDILEREGILERRDDPCDRRVFRIYLTDYGRSLKKSTAECAEKAIEDALAGISVEEKAQCAGVLQKIHQNLM